MTNPSVSSYEQLCREIEKESISADFKEAAVAIGGKFISADGGEVITLKMIDTSYELRKKGLFQDNEYCGDLWAKIIIYDYVRKRGRSPMTGELLPLDLFPHAPSHTKAFQGNAQKKIAARFEKDLPGLRCRCAAIGGSEAKGKLKADCNARFDLLPHVPLYLSFWSADEEFGADCKLLFDSSAKDYIDISYLAYLLERFAEKLVSD